MQWAGASQIADRVNAAMTADGAAALGRWAACGGMALTGRTDGPPLPGPARVALAFDALAALVAELTDGFVVLDGAALIGERAAIAGLGRQGATSAGGGCRLLPTADGFVALSLAREDDVALLDAWLGEEQRLPVVVPVEDATWAAVGQAVAPHPSARLLTLAADLGLPCSGVRERNADGSWCALDDVAMAPRSSARGALVVDLSSLWAGPLCANILGLAGARVVKVESTTRPDGARSGPAEFYDLLHGGHESVALDLRTDPGRASLRALLQRADVVIEGSRPRALQAMDASFADLRAAGWHGVWVSITGHGGDGDAAQRVAFGDDAAVAGGLVALDADGPVFCADALADPATGLLAATLVLQALADGVHAHIGLSLAGTAAHLAAGIDGNPPVIAPPGTATAGPRARSAKAAARPLGTDTARVLEELC